MLPLMKNVKLGQKINFPECDGDRKPRLLAAQNSRSFSCTPRFDQVTTEKLKKIMVFLCEIFLPIFHPKNQGILANILRNKVGIGKVIPR